MFNTESGILLEDNSTERHLLSANCYPTNRSYSTTTQIGQKTTSRITIKRRNSLLDVQHLFAWNTHSSFGSRLSR